MEDLELLNETFNLYYSKAKECLAKNEKMLAKRYYMLAAEQMLKMAKASDQELQRARFAVPRVFWNLPKISPKKEKKPFKRKILKAN